MDAPALYYWIVSGLLAIGLGLICWLMNRTIDRLDSDMEAHELLLKEHAGKHAECSLELAHFKAEVAKDYAKDISVQQSLSRIHERLDRLPREIIDAIRGVK